MDTKMQKEGLGKAPNQQQEQSVKQKHAPGFTMPTPAMQEAYDKVYGATLKLLYSEKFMPKAEEIVRNAPTPEAGVAQVASVIGARVYKGAQQAGEEIPDEVMLLGGWQVMQEIADFARTDVGIEMSDEQVESAFYLASEELRGMLGDNHNLGASVSPEDRAKLLEMSGGEEGAAARKQRIAAALTGKKGQQS